MSEKEELTERDKLCKTLGKARRFHRLAVRWLFEVSRLSTMYRDADLSWRGGNLAELAEVAQKDYDDAIKEVIQTRMLIDRAAKRLKDYDENE